ncbi:hypothetical protein EWB00_003912 [Schistosoma japonicum]|uniref:Uncharacterized protein n=1 Tax=Schistosoma japonicum TaxID=6182 RepID=A0A4Z2DVE0_SCHJA|nr:hypothetical protein EWB00_003912 [Schistosoma japonicum]
MEHLRTKCGSISSSWYHIVSFCFIIIESLILIIIQTVFSYCVPPESDLAWPSALIPFGYIPGSLLIITAGTTIAGGLTNSELWQATGVVFCILPFLICIAIACTTLQQYADQFPSNTSLLIMGVINCLNALFCLIHAILICVSQYIWFSNEPIIVQSETCASSEV